MNVQRFLRDHGHASDHVPPDGRAHSGYMTHANLVANKFADIRTKIDRPISYVIGHSLGGAVAHALPVFFPSWKPRVFSYGAPRIIRKQRHDEHYLGYIWPIVRICHNWDVVPMVPRILYRHPASAPLYIRYAGSVRSRRSVWSLATLPVLPVLTYHSMEHYAECLRDLKQ